MKSFPLAALVGVLLGLSTTARAEFRLGERPAVVSLQGDTGGRVDGKPWSSAELKDKVHLVFYVDPDEKSVNESLELALKNEKFPSETFQSTAIINMAATWLPNVAIASNLKSKQEQFPMTVYVKDLNKVLVKEWKFADDAYVVALIDKTGMPLFYKTGKFDEADTKQLIGLIKKSL